MKLSSPILSLTLFFLFFPSLLAEDCAPTKPLLKHVEEEWSDKKLISLQVNRTAFYDPDNQVVVKGTGDMPSVDPLDNYIINKMENKMETPTLVKNTNGKAKFLQK